MKKLAAAGGLALGLALTGCGALDKATYDGPYEGLYERSIMLEDGRKVTCVALQKGSQSGLSCDWDNAK